MDRSMRESRKKLEQIQRNIPEKKKNHLDEMQAEKKLFWKCMYRIISNHYNEYIKIQTKEPK